MVAVRVNPEPERYLPLFVAAGDEVGLGYPVRPDFARYRALIDAGDYLFIGAEDGGVPVGYVGVLFVRDLFNADVVHAVVDSFFVGPDYRKSAVAGRLLARMMPTVEAVAYDLVFQCQVDSPLAGMLAKRGFKMVDSVFSKVIGGL